MTEMTRPGETSNGRRYPSTPCGAGFPPVLPLMPAGNRQEPYDRNELSYAESARLTRATMAAEAAIVAARDGIREAHRRLVTAWHRGETAVRRVEEYAAEHRHGEAGRSRRRVLDRHAGDGAEDRRARPRWLSWWLVWPLILISAAYDTAFFAGTFQTALDVPVDAPWWHTAISYIPGFGIAMALILAGSWLAVPLLRHRNRAERRPTRGRLDWRVVLSRTFLRWRPSVETRRPGDLPWPSWPLPVAFLLALVGVLGAWAWLRGDGLIDDRLRGPLAALLVLLTVSAIAFKASAHNPFKDRDVESRVGLARSGEELTRLEKGARDELGEHTTAWQDFHAAVEDAAADSRRHVVQAWAEIADERGRHGLTGPIAPRFASADGEGVIFEGLLPAPAVRSLVLGDAGQAVERYRPSALEDRLTTALRAATDQLSRAMDPSGEQQDRGHHRREDDDGPPQGPGR
ncbi:hypothetical protein ACFY36_31570 [Actinoplanes sp. NPDC000266]